MSPMEIVLLVIGGVLFVVSFFLSDKGGKEDKETGRLAKEEINRLVEEKMGDVQNHIDDVVDEAVNYSMEKTERSLERLTNEKIMAVNEYSDTVLAEIHRNHEEVMFLYDMLNDKHTNLKDTVSKANQAAKEITDTAKEAEAVVNTFQALSANSVEVVETPKPRNSGKKKKTEKPVEVDVKLAENVQVFQAEQATDVFDLSSGEEPEDAFQNKNSQVLELHKAGKSNVAIAKELGLGVGEVKLIVDLFQNASE